MTKCVKCNKPIVGIGVNIITTGWAGMTYNNNPTCIPCFNILIK